jgi:Tol biopolymer transport system component/tRNA A-37 threonylcarbamoyl transferase component Bud32
MTSTQLAVALADRYRVERELGQGGMATVYLAHDLRHDRPVAIKVLHPELAAALGGERFLSEIKTTAKLQHPHILPLLDSGQADGLLFYVMPYVSGETLRARLERERQLPVADALRIAREAADALSTAHGLGIIHRDIKPENILLQGGHALVADFGIALAVQSAGGQRMTQTGLSLGTPQYMSPEQAMGEKTLDARADVYALGAVTYEMLCGEPPFTGGTVQAIVAKLMTDPPRPLTQLRKSVPVHVEAAVLAALEKVPADRIGSAAAFAQALDDPRFATGRTTVAGSSGRGNAQVSRPWLAAAVALNVLLAIMAAWLWLRPSASAGSSRHLVQLWQGQLPDPLTPGARIVAVRAAIAPDGSSIVYVDSTARGLMLMRKPRDSAEAAAIAGSEGAVSPFFSPDGKWIGYMTQDGRVRKVPVGGGGSITLAEGPPSDYYSGAWLDDGTIVYTDRSGSSVARVSADGGDPTPLKLPRALLGAVASAWPIPGSRGFLYTGCLGNCSLGAAVYVHDLARDTSRLLVPRAAGAWLAPSGHLLYTSLDGGLYAADFDAQSLELRGGAVPVLDGVAPMSFTLSPTGTALYELSSAGNAAAELVWVARDGRTEPFDSTWRGRFEYPGLAPDGKTVAVSLRDRTTDLWIRRPDGTRQKINGPGRANWRPSWMPDGKSLAFVAGGSGPGGEQAATAYLVRVEGGGKPEVLQGHTYGVWEAEVSRDGQWLVIRSDDGTDGNSNIRARRVRDTALIELIVTPENTLQLALSPDGRWLAYSSNESGDDYEIFVASFPDMKSKHQVSATGGNEARWAPNGRELFYKSAGYLMAAAVPPGPTFTPGTPRRLFPLSGYHAARNRPQYDVAPDGRFLMIREPGGTAGKRVVYAEGWLAELLAKVER